MGRLWYGFLVICFVVQAGAALAETTEERLQRLEQTIEDMKKHEAREREVEGQPPATKPGQTPNVQQMGAEGQGAERKYGSIMQGSGKLIYARPFVASPKAIVGGYADFEYFNRRNSGSPQYFDAHRLVPFIYADISEHVKFATEIEIEHGDRGTMGAGPNNTGQGMEIGIEFMALDYLINDKINLRGGIILLPIGKFNLLHDAPLRDLTDRPLVDQFIIPVALRQAGVGMYGTFYPTRRSKLDYELYATEGFTGFTAGSAASPITGASGLRGARFGGVNENNAGKSLVGRVAFSPFLGVEIGGSGFLGNYDPASNRTLSIWAVDWTLVRGPFELIGETAFVHVQANNRTLAGAATTLPTDMYGYYVQLNYHFLPPFLVRLAPTHFRPDVSTFTAVVRWEQTDLNRHFNGNVPSNRDLERVTFGLNFRPVEDTVFKFDFQYSPKEIGSLNGSTAAIHDTAFIASWATYF